MKTRFLVVFVLRTVPHINNEPGNMISREGGDVQREREQDLSVRGFPTAGDHNTFALPSFARCIHKSSKENKGVLGAVAWCVLVKVGQSVLWEMGWGRRGMQRAESWLFDHQLPEKEWMNQSLDLNFQHDR
jgi:hypothetical protein